jgi:hypothetical protein
MLEIWVGILVVFLISTGIGALFTLLTRKAPRSMRISLVLFAIAWIIVNGRFLFDLPALTRVFPFTNMLVLGSLQPFALGMLLGAAWHEIRGHWIKRAAIVCLGVGVCWWQCYGFLFRETPKTYDRWKGEVCRQSSHATCSAAAAVTLLRLHGISSNETEMARLCFTSEYGTTKFGLYRGLKIKCEGTDWEPRPLPMNTDALISQGVCPALISVRIDPGQNVDPRYQRDWGWEPGVSHTVVVLGFRYDGKVDIADPSVGKEQWEVQGIRDLWKGRGFYLARKTDR